MFFRRLYGQSLAAISDVTFKSIKVKKVGGVGGGLFLYDQDFLEWLGLSCYSQCGYIGVFGSSPSSLYLQAETNADVECFTFPPSGKTRELKIWGYRAGDLARSCEIGVGIDAANQVSFDGVDNYFFDGLIKATTGFQVGAAIGVSGSFTTVDGKIVTVTGGIITAIV